MVAMILQALGAAFLLIAAIGVIRLPDPLQRMHSATKAGTLGTTLLSACGGGGSDSPVGSAGAQSFTSGPISGLGSIVVGGVRFEDNAARIADDMFHWLDAPVRRVAATDTFVAYAPELEDVILPQVSSLKAAMVEILGY